MTRAVVIRRGYGGRSGCQREERERTPSTTAIVKKLRVSSEVRTLIEHEIKTLGVHYHHFHGNQEDQDTATQLIGELNLHIPKVATYERDARSKLAILDSDHNAIKSSDSKLDIEFQRYRRLYQCQSGTDNQLGRHASKTCHIPWENVGCGFWAWLTTTQLKVGTEEEQSEVLITVDEIFGNLVHSGACLDQIEMVRNPPIPIHPDLRTLLMDLLCSKTPPPVVKEKAREYALKRWGNRPGDGSYRFRLRDHDTSSVYRTLGAEIGIMVHTQAQDNLDAWLRPGGKPPDAALTAACLHYSPERAMAWRYGHKKQLLMDLTFGFSSARALLVILMVIDENNKGIPVAQMIFMARKDTKAVHADYNQALLDKILRIFKLKMGRNEAGEEFTVAVASTDNNTWERYALLQNFPDILLLLCMFHILQCWRNQLNRSLVGIPKGPERQAMRSRIWRSLRKLIRDISDYPTAITLYNVEVAHFKALGQQGSSPVEKKQSKAGLHFLNYLYTYLKLEDYHRSWSPASIELAAERMGTPKNEIARTTNHLESFNGRLKNKFFNGYERSGRLPRIDLWVLVLVTRVIPQFFEEWVERRHQLAYYGVMHYGLSSPESDAVNLDPDDDSDPLLQPAPTIFKTVQDVEKASKTFLDRAFGKAFIVRSNIYSKTYQEEHKEAVSDFMAAEVDNSDYGDDDNEDGAGQDVVTGGPAYLGTPVNVAGDLNDAIDVPTFDRLIPSQDCVEPSSTPSQTQSPTFPTSPVFSDFGTQPRSPQVEDESSGDLSIQTDYDWERYSVASVGDVAPDTLDILDDLSFLKGLDINSPPTAHPPALPASHSNLKVSAMMELQHAEDVWLQAIKTALESGLTQADIQNLLSPSTVQRLLHCDLLDDDPVNSSFEIPNSIDAPPIHPVAMPVDSDAMPVDAIPAPAPTDHQFQSDLVRPLAEAPVGGLPAFSPQRNLFPSMSLF
ncbi:hypothetical protein DFP72DRAFT_1066421 [Ephemerocybe angulata]|uniref:MULE transposase domain-containing protein n=1 Tax=Ephemerocybe angulata TaxID=980116 RepID=A0A8H6M6F1_9AGAR|nr:hypothetical protein DFP72DRAFT_1066421 [Tulosesus angulatus]